MGHVFQYNLRDEPPVVVKGDGMYLVDRQGKRYIDGSGGGPSVSCLGHSDDSVKRAIIDQLDKVAYAHNRSFTSEPAQALAEFLVSRTPGGMARAYFVGGGSEGVETALKMARQYFLEIGQPKRSKFIARWQSYHGNTLGALAVGGNRLRREPYAPMLIDVAHIAPCFAYRFKGPDETEDEYGRRTADALEAEILRLGPETVAAFIAETVVGATIGAVPPVPGYFKRIRQICDKYGVLLILDEVMCGMGRTGTLHAYEQESIHPDILVIAKGLAGGYQPIGAVIAHEKVYEAFERGSGLFQNDFTYIAHPVPCAAALAVQRAIEERDLLANVSAMGERLSLALRERFGSHPHVGDIRGRGLFMAVEFVQDRAAKRPFDSEIGFNRRLKLAAMERGLIVYPMGGTTGGRDGDHVIVSPPYIAEPDDIDTIVDRLGKAVDDVVSQLTAAARAAAVSVAVG